MRPLKMKPRKSLQLLPALAVLAVLLYSCGQQEARRPVQAQQGTFYRISAERARALLEQEQKAMDMLIEEDSTHTYLESTYGFFYAYTKGPDSSAIRPRPGDITAIRYRLSNLSGEVLYSYADIDTLAYMVDRDERLFKGLRDAVKVLRNGESARFLIPSSLAYGFAGDGDRIGPAIPLIADLELIDVIKTEESN